MITAGARFAAGLEEDGTVNVWGDGPTGVEGKGRMLAAGHRHLVVLGLDGTVRAWGDNARGQCEVPEDLPEIAAVYAGAYGSAAVDREGRAYFWGVAVEMGDRQVDAVREVAIGRTEVLVLGVPVERE
jgi:alpha-tubulin suppressor-like RCC1 family protein